MKITYILGAGVDRSLGLPLADGLLAELDTFSKDVGKDISKSIKDKLGGARRVSFNFDKYVMNQAEDFAERVLTDPELARNVENALGNIGIQASKETRAVQTLVMKLGEIRTANELDTGTADTVAALAGGPPSMADHTMLKLRGIAFNPAPRDALLRIFRSLESDESLSPQDKAVFEDLVASVIDVENLLTELFAGFFTGKSNEKRKYLYVSWLLWAYMWHKSQEARREIANADSFYKLLSNLDDEDSVITFNYTGLGNFPRDRHVTFHGDCYSYIRRDRGLLIDDDQKVLEAKEINDIRDFINGLEIDVDNDRLLLPAIVPPSSMKPIIHHSFVARWNQAETFMRESDILIAVGYAFRQTDSHFNDLFRQSARGKQIAVINSQVEDVRAEICQLLDVSASSLTSIRMEDIDVERSDSLLFVPAKCEEVTSALLSRIRQGW